VRPKPNLSRTPFRWRRGFPGAMRAGSSSCASFGPTGARTMQLLSPIVAAARVGPGWHGLLSNQFHCLSEAVCSSD
jgi:hypothetical protein